MDNPREVPVGVVHPKIAVGAAREKEVCVVRVQAKREDVSLVCPDLLQEIPSNRSLDRYGEQRVN